MIFYLCLFAYKFCFLISSFILSQFLERSGILVVEFVPFVFLIKLYAILSSQNTVEKLNKFPFKDPESFDF